MGIFMDKIKAYIDLTRLHFFFAWPLMFCSGLVLAFNNYGGFSWPMMIKAALIGFFGFEAGLVLNDYVDRGLDKKDVEFDKLTKYWRPFGKRPLISGMISSAEALVVIILFAGIAGTLAATLSYPHNIYVIAIMAASYFLEVFYQLVKRRQRFPFAQLIGRIDFAMFPVAGYLCAGKPDMTALLYFIFFYPLAQAHLGVNDMVDVKNDEARKMASVTALYGIKLNIAWIAAFTLWHLIMAMILLGSIKFIPVMGFVIAFILLIVASIKILKDRTPDAALFALPFYHAAMLVYSLTIITAYLLPIKNFNP